ncbi:MAG: PLP-dependent aminotransferase family protein, partial [Rhodospirillaceae bacterium]
DRLDPVANRAASDYAEAARAKGGRVKFAYLSVDFANPTGETVSLAVRRRVLDLADELDIAVIEDAAYQSLRFDGEAVPPILALDIERNGGIENSRTLYCSSFSKTLSPGLRVGWVCAAKPAIAKLVLMKQAADLHSPTLNQMAVHRVATAMFERQVETVRAAYKAKRDRMLTCLEARMPAGVAWSRPQGGMFVWLTLPAGLDAAELLAKSLETERVAFVPDRAFFADGSNANTLRLNFTRTSEADIDEGIRRLARLLEAQT